MANKSNPFNLLDTDPCVILTVINLIVYNINFTTKLQSKPMNKIILDNQTLKLSFNLSTIKSRHHFLRTMQEFFEFPAYFGNNFDALDEGMRDLSWFCQDNLIIEFCYLERINDIKLREFIQDCLICYQHFWQNHQDKNVAIFF